VEDKTRSRFRLEAGLAALSGVLALVTLLWRDWIELVFRVDPDRHNGSFEWLLATVFLGAAICFGGLAAAELRRSARAW
jgi:hypothetical protein